MKTRTEIVQGLVDKHEWAYVDGPPDPWRTPRHIWCRQCGPLISVGKATADIEDILEQHTHADGS